MSHQLQHPLVQRSYRSCYAALFRDIGVKRGDSVLDVGSGLGFLKPFAKAMAADYVGLEPDAASFDAARSLYGDEGFIRGFFPEAAPARTFDAIVALSCVDEVPDKREFLTGVRKHLGPAGVCYLAVRNGGFFVNRFKTDRVMAGRSERSRIKDLDLAQWEALFDSCGLKVIERGRFLRPWITGFGTIGLRNVAYRLISSVSPVRGSYMLYFKLVAR